MGQMYEGINRRIFFLLGDLHQLNAAEKSCRASGFPCNRVECRLGEIEVVGALDLDVFPVAGCMAFPETNEVGFEKGGEVDGCGFHAAGYAGLK